MHKKCALLVVVFMCLLSFPAHVFAAENLPIVNSGTSTNINYSQSRVVANVQGEEITNHGIEYGTTTDYGQSVQATTPPLVGPGYLLERRHGQQGSNLGDIVNAEGGTVDSGGNLWIADGSNGRVQKFDPQGNAILQVGQVGNGDGQLNGPSDVAIAPNGNVYVGDPGNYRIVVFDPTGAFLFNIGPFSWGTGNFYRADGLVFDEAGDLWVASTWLYKYDINGVKLGEYGVAQYNSQMDSADGIAIDGEGNILTVGWNGARVSKFDSSGNFLGNIDTSANGHQAIGYGADVVVNSSGHIAVTDYQNRRVQLYDSDGTFLSEFSDPIGNGWIGGLAVGGDDNIYVITNSEVLTFEYTDVPGAVSYSLDDLSCETTYHYRAFATNNVGTAYGQDQTFVSSVCPSGPASFNAVMTGRTATLSWIDPSLNDTISHYVVEYKKSSDEQWIQQPISYVEEDSELGIVNGLDPETEYDFRVRIAFNTEQSGQHHYTQWSDQTAGTTTGVVHYEITTCEEFQSIGLNPATKELGDLEGNYVLLNDIDCSQSAQWTWGDVNIGENVSQVSGFFPIMDPANADNAQGAFKGTFDGQNHTVNNISQTSYVYGGIFQSLQGATITNVTFDNVEITVGAIKGSLGALASVAQGNVHIDNVVVNGALVSSTEILPTYAPISSAEDVEVADDGHLFILDGGSRLVFETDQNGIEINRFAGHGSGDGQLLNPSDLTLDNAGNVFVVDRGNFVVKYDSEGNFLGKTDLSSGPGAVSDAQAIAVDSQGYIYVGDFDSTHRVHKYDANFNYLSDVGEYNQVAGLIVDANDNLYISDAWYESVRKYNSSGVELPFTLQSQGDPYELAGKMAFDSAGNFYVGSAITEAIQKFAPDGSFLALIGPIGLIANYGPFPLAVDDSGNLYRENPHTHRLDKYDAQGNFVTVIGSYSSYNSGFNVGGLVGSSEGENQTNIISITGSSVNVDISLDETAYIQSQVTAGGVIGKGVGTLDMVKAEGTVNLSGANSYYVGGVAGEFSGGITNSHASNDVNIESDSLEVLIGGGLVGVAFVQGLGQGNFVSHDVSIEDSYAWGSLVSTSGAAQQMAVGGIAGMLMGGTLKDTFSVETIDVGQNDLQSQSEEMSQIQEFAEPYVAGLVGMLMVDPTDVQNMSYDVTRAGTDVCYAIAFDPVAEEMIDPSTLECNKANIDGTEPDHFKNNHDVAPLDVWNFDDVWLQAPDQFPILNVGGIVIENPNSGGGSSSDPGGDSGSNGESNDSGSNSSSSDSSANSKGDAKQTTASKSSTSSSSEDGQGDVSSIDSSTLEEALSHFQALDKKADAKVKSSGVSKGDGGWLLMGGLSLTNTNIGDIIVIALWLLSIGFLLHEFRKRTRRKHDLSSGI